MTECVCPLAQYCDRHQKHMSGLHWNKCKAGHSDSLAKMYASPVVIPQSQKHVMRAIPIPEVSEVGTQLRAAFELEMQSKITCGACLQYLRSLNYTTAHDASTISQRLTAELNIPLAIRDQHPNRESVQQWVSTIVARELALAMEHAMDFRDAYDQPIAKTVPQAWKTDPAAEVFFRDKLTAAVATALATTYPGGCSGRGIVIPAGGVCTTYPGQSVPYFWLAHSAAYLLRRNGCELPIQFWFLPGEIDQVQNAEKYAASVGAVCRVLDTSDMRCPWGWQVKINAILQSEFQQVLHLDADNMVAADPTYLFESPGFEVTGALFWPDDFSAISMVENEMLRRVGLPQDGPHRDFDTGQILIDKSRCWQALQLCKYFADHADYWGGRNNEGRYRAVWYGDKTDFWMSWRLTGSGSQHMPRPKSLKDGFFAHVDYRERPLFQHCVSVKKKILLGEKIDGMPNHGCVVESFHRRNIVPWMDGQNGRQACEYISPERYFDIHDDDASRSIWLDIVRGNEYRQPDEYADGDVVIDVGGNTGAFAYASIMRGASVVETFEPYPHSFRRMENNIGHFGVTMHNAAVVGNDHAGDTITLMDGLGNSNPATFSTVAQVGTGWTAKAIRLDDVLRKYDRVRTLKIDCEGGEWSQLYTSQELHRVQEICGEYHVIPQVGESLHPWTAAGLRTFLESQGFSVEIYEHLWPWGHWWAKRS